MRMLQPALAFFAGALMLPAAPVAGHAKTPMYSGVWNGKPIRYRQQDGWALVEGDILLARLEEVQTSKSKEKSASATPEYFRLWPNATVVYSIDPDLPHPERVRQAIQQWEAQTPVRFVEKTDQSDWVTFRRTSSGCNSNVGRLGQEQFVNLSSACDVDAAIHEIGHTVGLYHTQSRSDRDQWLRVRYERIDREYWSQYDQHISDGKDIGPYSYDSLMHYSPYGFSREGFMVMVSIPEGIPVGQREGVGLTGLDVQAVHQLYSIPLKKALVTSNPPGLQVVVDGTTYATPRGVRVAGR